MSVRGPGWTGIGLAATVTFSLLSPTVSATDLTGQAFAKDGSAIPGLYATGEITGNFFFHNYPGGSGLLRGAVFGRIGGANAAAEALGK